MQQLLFNLCNAPCLGPVENAFAVAEEFLAPFAAVTRSPGRLIAAVPGTGEPVLLEAHLDEVGFTVTHVHPNGFLTVAPVGSVDSRILAGAPVTVLGQRPVPGVFTSVPPHLSSGSKAAGFEDLKIDIGRAGANLVRPGDFAVFCAPAAALAGSCVTAKALDNRSGVAAVLLAAQKAAALKGARPVTVLLTNGEELGCRGAKTAAFTVQPNIALVLEATTANDIAGTPPEKAVCFAGGGAVVSFMDRATLYDRELFELALATAAEQKIAVQTKNAVAGGNNAGAISLSGAGVRTLALSLPCRYIHSPSGIASLEDCKALQALAAALLPKLCCL